MCETTLGMPDVSVVFAYEPPGVSSLFENSGYSESGIIGTYRRGISFKATEAVNKTIIKCVITNNTDESDQEIGQALLLVQGMGY